jgi:hypothetical protein
MAGAPARLRHRVKAASRRPAGGERAAGPHESAASDAHIRPRQARPKGGVTVSDTGDTTILAAPRGDRR